MGIETVALWLLHNFFTTASVTAAIGFFYRFGPRLYKWLAKTADNEWHLERCQARLTALQEEILELRQVIDQDGGNDSSESRKNRPTTETETPSSSRSEK